MRRIVIALGMGLVATPAVLLAAAEEFAVEAAPSPTQTEIGLASWSTVCGEPLCCSETPPCCGIACSSHCCDSLDNCGLLGQGLLTYDPCGEGCELPELLLGWFGETDDCFNDFISPMTNPVFFEDPRITTEIRFFFLQHRVPAAAGGGDIQLYAMQLRAKLTENLALIAAKDGYADSSNALIGDGWADVDIGLKYQLYRDVKRQRLLSAGIVYDAPWGTSRTMQGMGDGEFHLFATGGTQLGCHGHWLSTLGGQIPLDQDANASMIYWSNHLDYQFRRGWYGLLECNWFHWTHDGDNRLGLTGVEGGDLFNFGSSGVAGNDIVTGAFGIKYKPNRKTEIGIAYEKPLTDRRDVLDNRLTLDLILRY